MKLVRETAKQVVLAPVHIYRRLISPALPQRCRYFPSCSTYTVEAVRTYGPPRGLVLAVWRLLRCNPFSHGGIDRVSDQRVFRSSQC